MMKKCITFVLFLMFGLSVNIPTAVASNFIKQTTTPPLTVIAVYTFQPNQLQKNESIINNLITQTRKEPGNLSYEAYQNHNYPDQLTFIERWSSISAHDKHLKSRHFIQAHKIIDSFLASKPSIQLLFPSMHEMNNPNQHAIFQVATINALAQGIYDGDYQYGSLMEQGNFGLGTFLALDGEMVAVDGHFYQIEANGKLKSVTRKQIVPFANVTYFKPTLHKTLEKVSDYSDLGKILTNLFPNKNLPYAIRIDGTFTALKLRSLRKQKQPYPSLAQAAEDQAIFNLQNVKGSIVGFWFPKYWAGIALPEFHLHFVTKDRTIGGHVLEINISRGELSIEPLNTVQVYLPNTKAFSQANFSAEELNSSVKKAEGGT